MPRDPFASFDAQLQQGLLDGSRRQEEWTQMVNAVMPAFTEIIWPTLAKCKDRLNSKMTMPCAESIESALNSPRVAIFTARFPSLSAPPDATPASRYPALRFEQADSGELRYGIVRDHKAKLPKEADVWTAPITAEWVADQAAHFIQTQLLSE